MFHKQIDIALVNETRLPQWFTRKIPTYKLYITDGPNPPHGGTAAIVKSGIPHIEVTLTGLQNLQSAGIITKIDQEELTIGALYQPPSKELITADLDKITKIKPYFIFGGDMNAKHTDWNSRLISTRGRQLERLASSNNYNVIGPTTPTCYPIQEHCNPDVLDIFLTKTLLPIAEITVLD